MGTFLQTAILMFITFRTNWDKEVTPRDQDVESSLHIMPVPG